MVLGYHAIMSFYGFWLPNDPRGSWSTWIRNWKLLKFGPATKVETRQSVAAAPCDHRLRRMAKQSLKYPPVVLNGKQALVVALGFKEAVAEAGYFCHACSILPDHVHLVLGRHERKIEPMLMHLRSAGTRKLNAEQFHPLSRFKSPTGYVPSVWARGYWKVFLDSVADMRRAIKYVEDNPLKEGKPRQHWAMVQPYFE
jgi:REP element-mobilizing transposase RayT